MFFQWKLKTWNYKKNQYFNESKNNKHNKYTVTKKCPEKTAVLKTDQDPRKITEKVHF